MSWECTTSSVSWDSPGLRAAAFSSQWFCSAVAGVLHTQLWSCSLAAASLVCELLKTLQLFKKDSMLLFLSPSDIGSNNCGYYDLQAVLTHQGRSSSSGHYVSWVKRKQGKKKKTNCSPVNHSSQLLLAKGLLSKLRFYVPKLQMILLFSLQMNGLNLMMTKSALLHLKTFWGYLGVETGI